jgi:60 kDa SS-A/Ro ribonucleoprotein
MVNKALFATGEGPATDAVNEAGGVAYKLEPKAALAQLAVTGFLADTYYQSGEDQLQAILTLCAHVEPEYVAKVAVYARQKGYMKDTPALLVAWLAAHREDGPACAAFSKVIDNGKMLRNFCQIIRSGRLGRQSFGSKYKRLIREWLAGRTDHQIFRDSVGNDPSLVDIVKMVHPKPENKQREALYGYLMGKEHNAEALPPLVKEYETYKATKEGSPPKVPFQMLTALELGKAEWTQIAKDARWMMTRMNLNTFQRHGVFDDEKMVKLIVERLADPEEVRNARAFPYQLLMAYKATGDVPYEIQEALQDAMEVATENVPKIKGNVYVFPDVSGSMSGAPVSGYRKGSTTAVRCIDAAALIAAAIMRTNPKTTVIPFEGDVVDLRLNPRDSVMTNAQLLASIGGGSTNCSAPLALVNQQEKNVDLVVYVSDNESWVDRMGYGRSTSTATQWKKLKKRCPNARMICIDLQAYTTVQIKEGQDIMHVGGFSDTVFDLMAMFANGQLAPEHWVGEIEKIEL